MNKTLRNILAGILALFLVSVLRAVDVTADNLYVNDAAFSPIYVGDAGAGGCTFASYGRTSDNMSQFLFMDQTGSNLLTQIMGTSGGLQLIGNAGSINQITYDGATQQPGQLIQHGTVYAAHEAGAGSAPSVGAGTACGTSYLLSISGTDASGEILLTEGTAPSNVGLVTVTFAVAYHDIPKAVTLTPANAQTARLYGNNAVYVPNEAGLQTIQANAFYLYVAGGALTPGTQYKWHYEVK